MHHGSPNSLKTSKMPEHAEVFSNPLAPPSMANSSAAAAAAAALTNADFRKLLMTPRAAPSVAPPTAAKIKTIHSSYSHSESQYNEDEDRAARRRKKKSYYAKLKKMEEEREQELAAKYRDRAKERREGDNPDYQGVDEFAATANYRAVGPTAEATNSAAERRRMAIQESKFLGGDMEHTHLVKGLDFALLQKVRSEISTDDNFFEPGERKKEKTKKEKADRDEDEDDDDDEYDDIEFKTRMGQRIYKAVFKNKPPERNELFMPGRMAYVFDLEDEYAESDIPTTLIRSKTDCPSIESQTTLTTNDIVINKLTQILSYLRQGMRGNKKMKKRDKDKMKDKNEKGHSQKIQPPAALESIYGDIGEYDPTATTKPQKKQHESGRERGREREKEREKKVKQQEYFEHSGRAEEEEAKFNKKDVSASDFARSITQKYAKKADDQRHVWDSGPAKSSQPKKKGKGDVYPDSYAECYPGGFEDATYDSEEEADYSKMDMDVVGTLHGRNFYVQIGNKKGPVRRWDFDTDEEYSKYMQNREALPKAAFQFGIKMSEGRKTRRAGPKDEKAKLDRDWQRISQILKRSGQDDSSGQGSSKKPKH